MRAQHGDGSPTSSPGTTGVTIVVAGALVATPEELRRIVSRMGGWCRKVFERNRERCKRRDGDSDRHAQCSGDGTDCPLPSRERSDPTFHIWSK